jgi:hypothetical protein
MNAPTLSAARKLVRRFEWISLLYDRGYFRSNSPARRATARRPSGSPTGIPSGGGRPP